MVREICVVTLSKISLQFLDSDFARLASIYTVTAIKFNQLKQIYFIALQFLYHLLRSYTDAGFFKSNFATSLYFVKIY